MSLSKFRLQPLLALLPLAIGCTPGGETPMVRQLLADARQHLAPDRRTVVFDVTGRLSGGTLTLTGEVHSPALKEQLLQFLKSKSEYSIVDSLNTLPHPSLGEKTHGVVTVSVANLRTQAQNAAELCTQTLLGTPLKVLKKESGWYYVQTPDQYLGWMDDGFQQMDEAEFNAWMNQPRVIITEPYGFTYRAKDRNNVVSDVAFGGILVTKGEAGSFYQVVYPDGREALLPKELAMPYTQWISNTKATPENIVRTAHRFFGVPYLWGGTSSKGFDCSGFTKTVFYFHGILLPRDASQQVHIGEPVDIGTDFENVRTGDLLFFGAKAEGNTKEKVTHVGIYLQDRMFIHASTDVHINSLNPADPDFSEYRLRSFLRVKRIIGAGPETGVHRLVDLPYYGAYEH